MTTTEHLLYHLRASGPADHVNIEWYLLRQAHGVTTSNAHQVTELSIEIACRHGWITVYGEPEPGTPISYEITQRGLDNLTLMRI